MNFILFYFKVGNISAYKFIATVMKAQTESSISIQVFFLEHLKALGLVGGHLFSELLL